MCQGTRHQAVGAARICRIACVGLHWAQGLASLPAGERIAVMEDATKVDEAWRNLLNSSSGWWSGDSVIRAAYEHPTLRRLLPFPTHGTLRFYTTPRPPWPAQPADSLPFIVCGAPPYRIFTAGYGQLIGEANTAEEAVTLLVASLPAGLAPRG
ncbi:DUF6193 family natural product biosynthesis protein [Micromonospora sp. NPDC000316]|uniref:DUF6193 family natural product biosynthesis protein n=1 Tax=Micromonospora sp. NPDC000316 TaxID=3364216 RepID=UPI00368D8F17